MTTYNFNSKYNKAEENMSDDEKKEAKRVYMREYSKFWYSKISPEKKQKINEIKKKYIKEHPTYNHKMCECCGKEYANIFQHYHTKAHIKNVTNSPKLMACN